MIPKIVLCLVALSAMVGSINDLCRRLHSGNRKKFDWALLQFSFIGIAFAYFVLFFPDNVRWGIDSYTMPKIMDGLREELVVSSIFVLISILIIAISTNLLVGFKNGILSAVHSRKIGVVAVIVIIFFTILTPCFTVNQWRSCRKKIATIDSTDNAVEQGLADKYEEISPKDSMLLSEIFLKHKESLNLIGMNKKDKSVLYNVVCEKY